MQYNGVTVEFVLVTPTMAKSWLANHQNYRKMNRAIVVRYATDMDADDWEFNGMPIILDGKGNVIDGQHRLAAIIKSEKSLMMLVVRGVKTADSIDTGKRRNLGDWLAHAGYKNVTCLSSAITWTWRFGIPDIQERTSACLHNHIPTMKQAIVVLQENPGLVESTTFARSIDKAMLPGAVVAALHYQFAKYDIEMGEMLLKSMLPGDCGLAPTDPIHLLREQAFQWSRNSITALRTSPYKIAVTIKVWNAWRVGTSMRGLTWRGAGPRAEMMPEIMQ